MAQGPCGGAGVYDRISNRTPVETDATRMCRLLVGLPTVTVLGVDLLRSVPIVVHVETRIEALERCGDCGIPALLKDRDRLALTDSPVFGKWRAKQWSTSIVDVRGGRLLDVVKEIMIIWSPVLRVADGADRAD